MNPPADFDSSLEAALHAVRVGLGPGGRDRQVCTMCIIIAHAKPHAVDDLRAAAAGKLSVRALHRALRASGIRIDRMSIQKHRNEDHSP